jgi:RNase P protein component
MGSRCEQRREPFERAFWDARPFTRLISWGRDFKNVARYIGINATETALSVTQKWSHAVSRMATRRLFNEIRQALHEGWLKKSPSLVAAGFV